MSRIWENAPKEMMGGDIIRKVELTLDGQKKYEVIKKLAEENGNKARAALTLNLSRRQVNRLLIAYRNRGKAAFIHGNTGRRPVTAIPEDTKQKIIGLYKEKYYDANFTHFTELLASFESINLSVGSVTSILEKEWILSPRVTKAKRKRIVREQRLAQNAAKTQKEKDRIQKNIVSLENAHSRRPRCAYFGELEQMDASSYEWVKGQRWHLHIAIDDATNTVTGAWFDTEETLNGYYHVLHQILTNYGIPFAFLTDRRTVFTYKSNNSKSLDEDTYTQFAYACNQLGVELRSSSVPQKKGRVERVNQTLQSRLPILLRRAGITTIDAANEFLHSYIKEFNAMFATAIDNSKSVFEKQPPEEKINLILAVLDGRTVDAGHCIKFKKQYYKMLDENGMQVHFRKGTKVMVIKAFDGEMYCCVEGKDVYALCVVPIREEKSKNFDVDYEPPLPKKKYIPPANHPWRIPALVKFARSQAHHAKDDDLPA